MSHYNFIPIQRDQDLLMPPSLREWLPEQDLAWFIIDAVSQMNLRRFYGKYLAMAGEAPPMILR